MLDEATPEDQRIPLISRFAPKAEAAKTLVITKKRQVGCWHEPLGMRSLDDPSDLCSAYSSGQHRNGGEAAATNPFVAEGFDSRQSMTRWPQICVGHAVPQYFF